MLGLASAFAAGIVSFVSPCVLPLVPAYVSYVAGHALDGPRPRMNAGTRLTAAMMSAYFVLGFSVVFIALGASATALGRLLLQYRYEANLLGGTIVIVFGLLMMGLARWVPWSSSPPSCARPCRGCRRVSCRWRSPPPSSAWATSSATASRR